MRERDATESLSESELEGHVTKKSKWQQMKRMMASEWPKGDNVEQACPEFVAYLTQGSGKRQLKGATASIYVWYLEQLLHKLNLKQVDFDRLKDVLVVTELLKGFQEETKTPPSGIMSRCSAIMHWFLFKEHTVPMEATAEAALQERMYSKLHEQYRRLHNSYKPARRRQDAMLCVEEEDKAVSTTFVEELLQSKKARRRVKSIMNDAKRGHLIGPQKFSFLLRYVTAIIAYTNVQRSGAVLNMCLHKFKKGVKKGPNKDRELLV